MKKLLLLVSLFVLLPTIAFAQCSGPFPANTYCGNNTGGQAFPHPVSVGALGGITVGATAITGGVSGDVLYDNAGTLGNLSPTITINGQACTLGLTCTLTAAASSFTPGTTTISGATAPCVLVNTTGTTSGCIDLTNSYLASGSFTNITGLGVVGVGTWHATVIGGTYGGTGVNNGASTLTLAASLTTTGTGAATLAFPNSSATFTFPGASALMAFTTGTLTNGHCVSINSGALVDAGGACTTGGGGGTVSSATANQVAYYASTGTTVSGSSSLTWNGSALLVNGAIGVGLANAGSAGTVLWGSSGVAVGRLSYGIPNTADVLVDSTILGAGIGFRVNANTTASMYLNSSGELGIGTTNPSALLHAESASSGATVLEVQDSAGGEGVKFQTNAGGGNYGTGLNFEDGSTDSADIKSIANGGLQLFTLGTAAININGSQEVGIGPGPVSPIGTLDVENGSNSATSCLNGLCITSPYTQYTDLRIWASLSCNPASLSSTNVAAAIYAASLAGWTKFFMPSGCFWDTSIIPGGSGWSQYTVPGNFNVLGENISTSGISTPQFPVTASAGSGVLTVSSGPSAPYTVAVDAYVNGNSFPPGTIITANSGGSPTACNGSPCTGSGGTGTYAINYNGSISGGTTYIFPQLFVGQYVKLDNLFTASGYCTNLDDEAFGTPGMCPQYHQIFAELGGSVSGYPYEPAVYNCGAVNVPTFTPPGGGPGFGGISWNVDNPCMALNDSSEGDTIFLSNGNSSGNIIDGFGDYGPLLLLKSNGYLQMFDSGGAVEFQVAPNGVTSIGNYSSPHSNGSIRVEDSSLTSPAICVYFAGNTVWSCSSDERLKQNIRPADDELAYVTSFDIKDYDWRGSGRPGTSVIAQEVRELHPEMVHVESDGSPCTADQPNGCYVVDGPDIWKLVKAMQEMQAEIVSLKRKVHLR